MNNLDTLVKERGLKNEYIIDKLSIPRSSFYRKKKDGTFTFEEIRLLLEILNDNKSYQEVTFKDLYTIDEE